MNDEGVDGSVFAWEQKHTFIDYFVYVSPIDEKRVSDPLAFLKSCDIVAHVFEIRLATIPKYYLGNPNSLHSHPSLHAKS